MNLDTVRAGRQRSASALLLLAGLVSQPVNAFGREDTDTVPASPEAVARFEGVASPGLRITLRGDRSKGRDLHFRWIQTRGTPANLDQPEGQDASFIVPEGEGPLGFLLIAGNANGVASNSITIPVESDGATHRDPALKADAGDDLVGFVGRQVTLNGIRSEPRGRIGHRWVQAGGPQVALKLESGCYYTFVPPAAGAYQFALVVASGDRISEPDYVSVMVGAPAPEAPTQSTSVKQSGPAPASLPTDEMTRLAVLSIDGGPALAPGLAKVFEDIAGRIDLYGSYEEAYSEMSRRLDGLIPERADLRAGWIEKLFNPLTLRMIERLRVEGLDLSRPAAQAAPLSPGQRKLLADHFRSMAEGLNRAIDGPDGPKRLAGRPAN